MGRDVFSELYQIERRRFKGFGRCGCPGNRFSNADASWAGVSSVLYMIPGKRSCCSSVRYCSRHYRVPDSDRRLCSGDRVRDFRIAVRAYALVFRTDGYPFYPVVGMCIVPL